jgi:hypothetical protein
MRFKAPALVGVCLLAAACSSASLGPGVASVGSSTTSTTAAPVSAGNSRAADYADAVDYAGCMRARGVVNFPDPDSHGDFLFKGGTLNGVRGVDPHSSLFTAADKACRHLLPNGGQMTAAEQQQALAQTLKYVQCMRTHGVANFPDPVLSNGGLAINLSKTGLKPDSPLLQAAMTACQSLSPLG